MGWKYLHSFLENFVYIIFCYIHCAYVLFITASQATAVFFMNSPLHNRYTANYNN